MNPIVRDFNKGFGNCIFINREPKNLEKTIFDSMVKYQFMPEIPTEVKITPIDELHDKLSLSLGTDSLEGVLTWRKTTTGAHYVLETDGFQLTE